MTNPMEYFMDILKFAGALSILTGGLTWRRQGPKEDDVIVSAATELLNGLSDADLVGKIENSVSINLRDQVTIEEVEKWNDDKNFHSWKNRN